MPFIDRLPRRFLVAAFWVAAIAVGVLALLPADTPMPSTGWDKSNHGLAFAVLGYLGATCWRRAWLRVLVVLAAYGGAIEIAQATLTTTRMGEWSDWLADCAGLAVVAAYCASRLRR